MTFSVMSLFIGPVPAVYFETQSPKGQYECAMAVTYYVALPFVRTEDGVAHGEAIEMPNERAATRRAEAMSRDAANAGALAFKRSGDPNIGSFADSTILKTFGEVPENLDEI
jgi:hypothetical protein